MWVYRFIDKKLTERIHFISFDFVDGRVRARNLKVVNDAAEREISLIQTVKAILTNEKEQIQYLWRVVKQHRPNYPNLNKSTINH